MLDIGRSDIDREVRAIAGVPLTQLHGLDSEAAGACLKQLRRGARSLAGEDFTREGKRALKSAMKKCKYALRHGGARRKKK